ncbi:MAG: hypothetical protein ABI954_02360 [Pyrinomonadaceae bacterium]
MKQIGFLILFAIFAAPTFAQSTNENFPTPIVQNVIGGTIAARDIGDSRLTRHFYTFFADNGDVNLEIETANFDGDIDLFESETLRPLAKITVVAENQLGKTSRIIYFRKREQIVLRIEGRPLTDEIASYRITFSGSFAAAVDLPQPPADLEPKVAEKSDLDAVAKVNSAGTITEVFEPKKTVVEPPPIIIKTKPGKQPTVARRNPRTPRRTAPQPKPTLPNNNPTENTTETADEKPPGETDEEVAEKPAPKIKPTARSAAKPARVPKTRQPVARKPAKTVTEASASSQPDPLANVQLIILLKNGERVERPMSEVFNVSVDKGRITVITKTGKIERYNLLEVQKMTIE